jgi:hypothetical protein
MDSLELFSSSSLKKGTISCYPAERKQSETNNPEELSFFTTPDDPGGDQALFMMIDEYQ